MCVSTLLSTQHSSEMKCTLQKLVPVATCQMQANIENARVLGVWRILSWALVTPIVEDH